MKHHKTPGCECSGCLVYASDAQIQRRETPELFCACRSCAGGDADYVCEWRVLQDRCEAKNAKIAGDPAPPTLPWTISRPRKMTLDVWTLRRAFPSQSVPAMFEGFQIGGIAPCCGRLIPLSWSLQDIVENDGLEIGCTHCNNVDLFVRVPDHPRRSQYE